MPGSVEEVIDTLIEGDAHANVYPVIGVPPLNGATQCTTMAVSMPTDCVITGASGGEGVGMMPPIGFAIASADEPTLFNVVTVKV
jgi:hypothetical protein